MSCKVKKIFVAHCASIGDTMLATPVYRAIKESYPESRLVVMASPSGKEVLIGNPYIDSLISYQKGDSIFAILKQIWHYDVALIFDFHYRSGLIAWLAMISKRIGRGDKKKSILTDCINIEDSLLYEPLKYLKIAERANISTNNIKLVGPVCSKHEIKRVEMIVAKIREENPGKKLVMLAPYSLSTLKDWPSENYQKLILFLKTNNCIVAIIGGSENRANATIQFPAAINLVGDTNLRETKHLIELADLLICGCTSVLHLAATTNTPQISIYGPTAPRQWAPKNNCTVITHNFSCSPCYNSGNQCEENKCIQDITCEEVCSIASNFIH